MNEETLRKLEGLHTIETAAETLKISRQSALNLLSKLKKQNYITTSGGGKKKRIYKITMKRQLQRVFHFRLMAMEQQNPKRKKKRFKS